jgi:hypothetical protein
MKLKVARAAPVLHRRKWEPAAQYRLLGQSESELVIALPGRLDLGTLRQLQSREFRFRLLEFLSSCGRSQEDTYGEYDLDIDVTFLFKPAKDIPVKTHRSKAKLEEMIVSVVGMIDK